MQIVRPVQLGFTAALAVLLAVGVGIIGARLMPGGAWLGVVAAVVTLWMGLRVSWRRWRAVRRSFPEAWRTWLREHVPLYAAADTEGRTRFERDVQCYLAEQAFEAVGEVRVTDELRLGVAAGAALLLHGRPDWELSMRRTVLFYPDRFDDAYYDDTSASNYDGMVHEQGPMILSVRAVEESWADSTDGSNVVLHELAHLFDFDNSLADGTPSLMDPSSAEAWARLVKREMRAAKVGKSLLRRYAATNGAELFAVAVENFFERPEQLWRRHRALYDALAAFFALDPRALYAADAADGLAR